MGRAFKSRDGLLPPVRLVIEEREPIVRRHEVWPFGENALEETLGFVHVAGFQAIQRGVEPVLEADERLRIIRGCIGPGWPRDWRDEVAQRSEALARFPIDRRSGRPAVPGGQGVEGL